MQDFITKDVYNVLFNKFIKPEKVSLMWQNFNKKELKIIGVSNIEEICNGCGYYINNKLFAKVDGGGFRVRKDILEWILQNKPLTEKQLFYAECLIGDKFNDIEFIDFDNRHIKRR